VGRAGGEQLTPCLVAERWDSTLNATFDRKCVADPAVRMSASERGCAWSHLATWRSVQLISGALFGNTLARFEVNAAGDGMAGWQLAVPLYRACFGRGVVPLLRARAALDVDCASLRKRLKHRVARCEPLPPFDALRLLHPAALGQGGSAGGGIAGGGSSVAGHSAVDLATDAGGGSGAGSCDWYLIVEDDATVGHSADCGRVELRARLVALLAEAPADWDLLYLGCVVADDDAVRAQRMQQRGAGTNKRGRDEFVELELQQLSRLLRPVHYSWHAHAYLVRSSTVTKLLRFLPVNMPVDNFMSTLVFDHKLKAYAARTQLVKQQVAGGGSGGSGGGSGYGVQRRQGVDHDRRFQYRGDISHSASLREGTAASVGTGRR
jgi:GR25 family glycosyltransferase involved in LPS biosynthesis